MPQITSEVVRTAGRLRGALGQLHRRLRQVDNAEVLTPSQSAVLGRLYRDGPATQAILAAAERVRQQSMAATLGALDELGYIERTRDPSDGRRTVISLSERGEKTSAGVRTHRNEWIAEVLSSEFSPTERNLLDQTLPLLERLAAH